jgi:hypothetical protein
VAADVDGEDARLSEIRIYRVVEGEDETYTWKLIGEAHLDGSAEVLARPGGKGFISELLARHDAEFVQLAFLRSALAEDVFDSTDPI